MKLHGIRQDAPPGPGLVRIDYQIDIDTDEPERRLGLMHENIRKFGTIYNTVAASTELTRVLRRTAPTE